VPIHRWILGGIFATKSINSESKSGVKKSIASLRGDTMTKSRLGGAPTLSSAATLRETGSSSANYSMPIDAGGSVPIAFLTQGDGNLNEAVIRLNLWR
jgi:hypothetical protein